MSDISRARYIYANYGELFDNIRWIILGVTQLIFVYYVDIHGRNYQVINCENTKYTGLKSIIQKLRNIEEIVYCVSDYTKANKTYKIDDIGLMQQQRKTLVRLKQIVYTDVAIADIKEILCDGLCDEDDSIGDMVLLLEKRSLNKHEQQYLRFNCTNKWYNNDRNTYASELENYFVQAVQETEVQGYYSCNQYDSMLCATRTLIPVESQSYMTALQQQPQNTSNIIVTETLQKQVTGSITAYRAGLTADLLYTIVQDNRYFINSVTHFAIDYNGHLYLNGQIINYKIPSSLLSSMPDYLIWLSSMNCDWVAMRDTIKQQGDICNYVKQADDFGSLLSEQRIPRWGLLFDLTQIHNVFPNLQQIELLRNDVWLRYSYINNYNIANMVDLIHTKKMKSINMGGLFVNRSSIVKLQQIKQCVLLQNTIRQRVGLLTDKVIDNRRT